MPDKHELDPKESVREFPIGSSECWMLSDLRTLLDEYAANAGAYDAVVRAQEKMNDLDPEKFPMSIRSQVVELKAQIDLYLSDDSTGREFEVAMENLEQVEKYCFGEVPERR